MVTRALANFGPVALDPVIKKFGSEDVSIRNAAVIVLVEMLGQGSGQKGVNSASVSKIKQVFVTAARDPNPDIRISAIEGLAKLSDSDARRILEDLAHNDPYDLSQRGGSKNSYPVREAALKALRNPQ